MREAVAVPLSDEAVSRQLAERDEVTQVRRGPTRCFLSHLRKLRRMAETRRKTADWTRGSPRDGWSMAVVGD